MIYIETGTDDVYLNFGVEYYFAAEKQLGEDVLLLWSTTPTIMLGKYQNPYEEIDLSYASAKGIHLVRRLSGGGAIYTDGGGFQYSFIGGGGEDIEFERYMIPIVEALRKMGVEAESSGRNDIMANGRKISGNAQFKASGRTVHHGSLLFSTNIEEMERATALPEYKIRSKAIKSVRDRVVNISDLKGMRERYPTPTSFKKKLLTLLPVSGEYVLTDADLSRVRSIAETKFRDEKNIFGSSPNFTIEKECRTPGGTIIFGFEVKRGIVSDASVRGDFFSADSDGVDSLRSSLIGLQFKPEAIKRAVASSDFNIYGITSSDLSELL